MGNAAASAGAAGPFPELAAGSHRCVVGTAGPFQGLRADREQRKPPSTPQGPQFLSRNYGPD